MYRDILLYIYTTTNEVKTVSFITHNFPLPNSESFTFESSLMYFISVVVIDLMVEITHNIVETILSFCLFETCDSFDAIT